MMLDPAKLSNASNVKLGEVSAGTLMVERPPEVVDATAKKKQRK